MLCIVLGTQQQRTVQRFLQHGWQVFQLTEAYASRMNELLASVNDPFICMLPPGKRSFRLQPSGELIRKLEELMKTLPDTRTGVLFGVKSNTSSPEERRAIPLLWNRNVIQQQGLTRGFADKAMLPFESYVLEDKYAQLYHAGAMSWDRLIQQDGQLLYCEHEQADDPASRYPCPFIPYHDPTSKMLLPLLYRSTQPSNAGHSTTPKPPWISVVMCCFNENRHMPWAVRSLMAQGFPDWELLLIDDGSQDPLDLKQLGPWGQDTRIRWLRHHDNKGKAVRLNEALELARGSWFLELDADDWLAPDGLEILHQHAAFSSKTTFLYSEHDMWSTPKHELKEPRYAGRQFKSYPLPSWDHFIEAGLPLAPRCFRTETLRQLGGWWTEDPLQGRYYEDIQIIARYLKRFTASQSVSIPLPLYHRRIRRNSSSQHNKSLYISWKQWLVKQLADD